MRRALCCRHCTHVLWCIVLKTTLLHYLRSSSSRHVQTAKSIHGTQGADVQQKQNLLASKLVCLIISTCISP